MNTLALAIVGVSLLSAHELPDDTVDRGLELLVRVDRIEIDYELDMNLTMVERTLREVNKLPVDWKAGDLDTPRAAELLEPMRLHMLNEMQRELKVWINDQPRAVQTVRVLPSAKHTALLRATYYVHFKSQTAKVRLKVQDRNLAQFGGWRRIAAKPRLPVSMEDSPTAPLLVRIPRDIKKPLTAAELKATETLELEFEIPEALVWDGKMQLLPTEPASKNDSASPEKAPSEHADSNSPAVSRPHIGWFLLAFCLMSLLAFYCHSRSAASP